MAERNLPHILITQPATAEGYSSPPRRIDVGGAPSPPDRRVHGQRLAESFAVVAELSAHRRQASSVHVDDSIDGTYVTFTGWPETTMKLTSLDPQYPGAQPQLRAVNWVEVDDDRYAQEATVFVPRGKLGYFLTRLREYSETALEASPKNRALVDSIEQIAAATVRDLWTDPPSTFPNTEESVWWEVWLRRRDENEIARLKSFAEQTGATVGDRVLEFNEYRVATIRARILDLTTALDVIDDIAELRRPTETADLLHFEPPYEQASWVAELQQRLELQSGDLPVVCVLDTGVYRHHPLLAASIDPSCVETVDPAWGTHDHDGHGTAMAGLALYGDLLGAIRSGATVRLSHGLESVKILPPAAKNDPDLYGAITAAAAAKVEIAAPFKRRTFSLAVTAQADPGNGAQRGPTTGQPTSWSAAIDAMAFGEMIDVSDLGVVALDREAGEERRLFLVSAGNVYPIDDMDHISRSQLEPVEDPGQSWNAITVGAMTELDDLSSMSDFAGWSPVADRGELSPSSRTSVLFDRAWPEKPDIVMEGGNSAVSPGGTDFDEPESMQLLTTAGSTAGGRMFTLTNATSAATAQAAHLAAVIMSEYPSLWPETVRALLVSSAEWSEPVAAKFDAASKTERHALLRTYGMGTPSLDRALRSAQDALVLVVQDELLPFAPNGTMNEMHLHDLPWPRETLEDLGEVAVRLRVTLSYFIEPNPARRGWNSRYSYMSHGLRFDLLRPTESREEFRQRINAEARTDTFETASSSDPGWFLPAASRTAGSLHCDMWQGTAAQLSARGTIAVRPVTGWWKERSDERFRAKEARYGLVVAIETPEVDADIWTPVAAQIQIPIPIDIATDS